MSTDNAGEGLGYSRDTGVVLCDCPWHVAEHPATPAEVEPDAGDANGLSEAERSWGITRPNGATLYAEADVARIKREAEQRGAEKALRDAAYDWPSADVFPGEEADWLRARADATRSR